MIIDNPYVLRGVCKTYRAKATQPGGEALIQNPKITKFLDKYSKTYKKISDPIWETEYRKWYKVWFDKK